MDKKIIHPYLSSPLSTIVLTSSLSQKMSYTDYQMPGAETAIGLV